MISRLVSRFAQVNGIQFHKTRLRRKLVPPGFKPRDALVQRRMTLKGLRQDGGGFFLVLISF
jgi:hypothetical protein